jgi:putative two-component system response regulator
MDDRAANDTGSQRRRRVPDSLIRRYLHRALSLRDAGTALHTHRVSLVSEQIGAHMGCSPHEARALFIGSTLHDIGKLGTPDAVLKKSGLYDDNERTIMRSHCLDGFEILRGKVTHEAAMIALCHHERYDGTGYPTGMIGDDIPISARVCSVADYFDAATSDHGGPARRTNLEAADEISRHRATWFDPAVVDAFLRAYELKAFDEIPAP